MRHSLFTASRIKRAMSVGLCAVMAVTALLQGKPAKAAEAGAISVYTGEAVSAELANTRPIAVMMPTDKVAQPSYGISRADILYEIMEEGDISRQLAVIPNWQDMERIGNIRSCRLYYIPEAAEWDAILIHFGGVVYMKDRITAPDIDNMSGNACYGVGGPAPGSSAFFRTSDRSAPHNAYVKASAVIREAGKLGYSLTNRPQYYNAKHFTFSGTRNTLEQYPGATAAGTINLSKIFPYTKTSFTYSAADGKYYKTLHGSAHKDGMNGQQLAFSNVIIQNTKWAKADKNGYLSFQNLDTTEDGWFCTSGKAIHVTWKKSSDHEPTRYYDDNGAEIALNPGKTYIAIAQKERSPIFQ